MKNQHGGERADLHNAELRYANLGYVNLCYADLHNANLCDANLHNANLCGADLSHANLCGTNLCDANLHNANLNGAILCNTQMRSTILYNASMRSVDLHNASLCHANLYYADLRYANLCGADLYNADLHNAKLSNTKNVSIPITCPDSGCFIGWKKANGRIVKLLIPEDARRSSSTGRKCRCDKAIVVAIEKMNGEPSELKEIASDHDSTFIYKVGEIVMEPNFCEDRFKECAEGIHFFINRQEAVEYN